MKMRSKKLLAFALTFCVSFSGVVPVGAVSGDTGEMGQRAGQMIEDMSGNAASPQEEPGSQIIDDTLEEGDGILEDGIYEDAVYGDDVRAEGETVVPEETAAPQETVVSTDTAAVLEEETSPGAMVSEDQALVSGNDAVVETPEWFKIGERWLLKKPSSSSNEFYVEEDGLVLVKCKEGDITYDAYYTFDKDGAMLTGSQELKAAGGAAGVHYFLTAEDCKADGSQEAPTPKNSKIGQKVVPEQPGWYYAKGDGKWLYLQENGVWDSTKVGIQKISENTYFLDKDGIMQKDVQGQDEKGDYYYFGADGVMVTNRFVQVTEGEQYYFTSDGKRFEETGWQRLSDGQFYYFHKKHYRVLKTGWQKIKENSAEGWYYFSKEGKMYVDASKPFKVDGYQYCVDKTGKMLTGLRLVDGSRYYFRTKKEGKAPLGSAYKGWKKISGRWYYFKDKTFQAEAGRVAKIDKKYYYFDKKGRMFKGGWKVVDEKIYFFQRQTGKSRNGNAVTKKWVKKGKKWYYASAKGAMRTDAWIKSKGNYYYLGKNGVMVTNKWKQRDGKWGYLDGDGVFSQNWIKVKGKWKYAYDNGKFAKGWSYIVQNGIRYKYFFDKSGYLIQDVRGKVSGPYMVKIDRRRNQITIYAKDTDGQFNVPVVAMPCCVGMPSTPTPTGRFKASQGGRWQSLMGPSYGQYGVLVDGNIGIFIHSVPCNTPSVFDVPPNEWNKLGREPASHGCIRVSVIDCKWIYEHCIGSTIEIQDYNYAGPFDHKTYPRITAAYNWDPTDPLGKGYL